VFRRSRGSDGSASAEERYYYASQSQLIWQKFRKHRLAVIGGSVLLLLYLLAIFCDFVSPYSVTQRFSDTVYRAPSRIHMIHEGRLQLPFVYGTSSTRDPETFELIFVEEKSERYPIRLFVRSDHRYRFLGLIPTTIKLFGVEAPGAIHLFGTDSIGRDLFTRTLCGARLSLSIGLVGVFISFLIGIVLGGISGYFGGVADMIIQRVIEFLIAIPTIPLWLALSASLPRDWPVVRVYFGIVIILSLISWGGLARVVRGKLLELREQDYAMAAKVTGMSDFAIIWKHLLPNFASYLIVYVTLAVPDVILGETALSFLGLGLRSPAVSWGVLLQKAQNIRSIAIFPWMLIPALFVVITVLAFNFLGDGLRDAADPYKD
jgi:peptide/nickel transport system permease protein